LKVQELIDDLLKMNPDAELVLQKDSEGNGYSPCAGADDEAIYVPENTWSGVVYDTTWSIEDVGMDEDEWEDLKKTAQKAVVLYPIN